MQNQREFRSVHHRKSEMQSRSQGQTFTICAPGREREKFSDYKSRSIAHKLIRRRVSTSVSFYRQDIRNLRS
eukprot:765275-Hanusia_phi.AAC.3